MVYCAISSNAYVLYFSEGRSMLVLKKRVFTITKNGSFQGILIKLLSSSCTYFFNNTEHFCNFPSPTSLLSFHHTFKFLQIHVAYLLQCFTASFSFILNLDLCQRHSFCNFPFKFTNVYVPSRPSKAPCILFLHRI